MQHQGANRPARHNCSPYAVCLLLPVPSLRWADSAVQELLRGLKTRKKMADIAMSDAQVRASSAAVLPPCRPPEAPPA